MAFRIGVPREYSRRKEVDTRSAFGTIDLLDPKEIQHVCHGAIVQLGLVERLDLVRHVALDRAERIQNGFGVVLGEPVSDEEVSHGIDVAANGPGTKLERFADRGAASHERIEDDRSLESDGAVEGVEGCRYPKAKAHPR